MKAPKPKLSGLPFSSKPATPATTAPAEPSASIASDAPADAGKAKDDRVPIILRVSAEDRKALKIISAREGRTVQDMLHDAMQDILRRSR